MLADIAFIICMATAIHFLLCHGLIMYVAWRNRTNSYVVTDIAQNTVMHVKFIIGYAVIISVIQWLIH